MTLSAAEDHDALAGTAAFTHTASGGDYSTANEGNPVTAELTATEGDNDTAALTLAPTSVTVPEGSTANYTVKLATLPSVSVTVAVAKKTTGDQDGDLSLTAGASLTFSTSTWSSAQTVTLSAAEDHDAEAGTAVFTHTASGGDYGNVSKELTATEGDNDTPGLVFVPSAGPTITEGTTGTYTVKLATLPSAAVTVAVAKKTSGTQDGDLSLTAGASLSLTFSTSAWNTPQTVTLSAAADLDGIDGTAVFTHEAEGGDYDSVSEELTATENDDDTAALTLSPTSVEVDEGATANYTVKLATLPSAKVTVAVTKKTSGDQDGDLSVKTGASLTFTTTNYSSAQTVTLSAAEDHDAADGTAVFTHTASGGDYGTANNGNPVTAELTATEDDDDTPALVFDPSGGPTISEGTTGTYTVKLATLPSAKVTVAVAKKTGGDQDGDLSLTAGSSLSLTFTTSTWSSAQTVTLSAAADLDGIAGTADFTHTASGGDYAGVTADLTATEDDDDTAALVFDPSGGPTITEGTTGTYTVKLATLPSAKVTVEVAKKSGGDQDGDLSLTAGSRLTFTTGNWSTAQTVTLSAAADLDAVDGTAVFEHEADGGDYDSVTGELTATENDKDTAALTLSPASVEVDEGATANYTVKLATQPSAKVTVAVARKSGNDQDGDLSVKTGASLTFTTANYSSAQTVTLSAAEDHDAADGTAVFTHTASGGDYSTANNGNPVTAELTATEDDDDTPALVFDPSGGPSVTEGATGTYTVKLATLPSAKVTVAVAKKSGSDQDGDLSLTAGSSLSLTFTTSTWSSAQTVTLSAAADLDGIAGTADFTHTASGGDYAGVTADLTATEDDDDTAALVFDPSGGPTITEGTTGTYTVKLATLPSAKVTVEVAKKSGGDQDGDLSLTAGSRLTFTTGNWSTAQTVTLSAAADLDAVDGTAVFEHEADGGDYDSVTGELTATENDKDTAALTLSPASVEVDEGATANYTVKLATQPSAKVTVAVARKSGNDQDGDLSVTAGASLTFTTANYSTAQTVTLSAAQDPDALDDDAVFVNTASGGDYGTANNGNPVTAELTATEEDDDTAGLVFDPSAGPTVSEGATGTYTVKLATLPSASVTVAVAKKSGNDQDGDLSLKSGASLTFTTSTWSSAQTVTLSAAQDHDALPGTADFTHTASGGDYDSLSEDLTATEDDDDTAALVFDPSGGPTITEGTTGTYTVKLATLPSGKVTVAVAKKTSGDQDGDLSLTSGSSLTFTTSTWSTAQTVTLSAAQDLDALAGTAAFTHTASGGDYSTANNGNPVTAELTATEGEDDTAALVFDPSGGPTVSEGSTGTYTVKLATLPSGKVTVAVAKKTSGTQDGDLSLTSGSSLTFTTSTWSTAQTVTLSAGQDLDAVNGTAVFEHDADGGDYASVTADLTATEGDDETAGLVFNPPGGPTVSEGTTGTYTVKLATLPSGTVTVAVAKKSTGDQDGDLSVTAGASLTFTTSTWSTAQTVTLSAAADLDAVDGTAAFTHTGSGGDYGSVSADLTATENDDDTAALTLAPTSVTVNEGSTANYTVKLATRPSAKVTVAVARKSGSGQDRDLSVTSGASLTFTTSTWSNAQTVTLSAAQDPDALNHDAVFVNTASGADYGTANNGNPVTAELTATEGDDDTAALVFDPSGGPTVSEGDDRDLHGEAGHPAFGERDGCGGEEERRPGRGSVPYRGRVPDLQHLHLEHRPDGDPVRGPGPRRPGGHRGLHPHRQRRRLRQRER